MTASTDRSDFRLQAALDVDHLFTNYLLEFSPAETSAFIANSNIVADEDRNKVLEFLRSVDDVIPHSIRPQHKGPYHTYRTGRDTGRRIIYLRLPTQHFPKTYRYVSLYKVLERHGKKAGALSEVQSGEHFIEVMFWWI